MEPGAVAETEPLSSGNTPAPSDGPKPLDPEKRAAAAKAREARKLKNAVKDAKSADEFWKAIEGAAEKAGRKVATPAVDGVVPAPAAVVAQLDAAKVAKWEGPALQLWQSVHMGLSAIGEGNAIVKKFAAALAVQQRTMIGADEQPVTVTVDPVQVLAAPTAKCAAKWVPETAMGPEAELGTALALTFGPVIVALVIDAVQAREKKKPEAVPDQEPAPKRAA